MSGVALAACAATLTSTTYAWYTSNTSVTAGGINGTTAESGSELLLISQDYTNWSTSIANVTETDTKLIPMEYNVGASNAAQGTLGAMDSSLGTDDSGYVTFDLYLKNASTKQGNLKMEITSITNSTTKLPTKPVIGANHKYIGIASSNSTYTVDMLRVLCMEVEVYTNTHAAPTKWALRSDNVYEMETHATLQDDSLKGSSPSTTDIADPSTVGDATKKI